MPVSVEASTLRGSTRKKLCMASASGVSSVGTTLQNTAPSILVEAMSFVPKSVRM